MWFFFGFITFTIFAISFGYKRINACWEGVPGFNEKSIKKLAANAAPRLLLVAAALIKAGQGVEKQRRDPFVIKAAIILDR